MVALAGVARARNVTAGTDRFASQMNDGLRPLLKVGNSRARIVLPSGVACITSAVHGRRKARSYRLKPHHPGDLDLIAIQVCRACLKGKAPPSRSPEAMHAAVEIDAPTYAHEIPTTAELVALERGLPVSSRRARISMQKHGKQRFRLSSPPRHSSSYSIEISLPV